MVCVPNTAVDTVAKMKSKLILATLIACCLVPKLALASDELFDSKGVKIRYVTAGEGEAVVLIHGWMGDSSMWGRDAAGNTKLSPLEGFQAIAIDCRGHGKSDKPHDEAAYGTKMADDVVRLLDHLKIKKAHLIGYSMGAFIAGKVASAHPDRVISVIYGGQAPLIKGAPSTGSNEVEVFAKAVADGKGLGSYLVAVMPEGWPKLTLEQANAYAKVLYAGKDVEAFAASGLSLGRLAVSPKELRRFKGPVMFVYGSKDISRERINSVRDLLGHGEVKVVEGADHVTTPARPEFGASIVGFLQANKLK